MTTSWRKSLPPVYLKCDDPEDIKEAIEGPLNAIRSIPSEALRRIDELLAHDPGRVVFPGMTDDERRQVLGLDLAGFQEDPSGRKTYEGRLRALRGQLDGLGLAARQVDAALDRGYFISPECQRHCDAVKGWLK